MFLLFILFVLVVIFLLFSLLRFFRVFILRDSLFSSLRLFARPPRFFTAIYLRDPLVFCAAIFFALPLFFSPLGSSYARFSLLFCVSRQKSPPHRALVFLCSICWFADVYGCRMVTSTAKNIIYQSEIYTKFSQFATPTH